MQSQQEERFAHFLSPAKTDYSIHQALDNLRELIKPAGSKICEECNLSRLSENWKAEKNKEVTPKKSRSDSESTNEQQNQQDTQDKHFRVLFDKIYIEKSLVSQLLQLKCQWASTSQSIECLNRFQTYIIQRGVQHFGNALQDKLEQSIVKIYLDMDQPIELKMFFKYFQEFMKVINLLNYFYLEMQAGANQIDQLLRYLENKAFIEDYEIQLYSAQFMLEKQLRLIFKNSVFRNLFQFIKKLSYTNVFSHKQCKNALNNLKIMTQY